MVLDIWKERKSALIMLLLKFIDHNNYAFHILVIQNFTILPPDEGRDQTQGLMLVSQQSTTDLHP